MGPPVWLLVRQSPSRVLMSALASVGKSEELGEGEVRGAERDEQVIMGVNGAWGRFESVFGASKRIGS